MTNGNVTWKVLILMEEVQEYMEIIHYQLANKKAKLGKNPREEVLRKTVHD